MTPLNPNCPQALALAQQVAVANPADGQPLPPTGVDIRLGSWDLATNSFRDTACVNPLLVNAVQATTSREITWFFGQLITGQPTTTLTATCVVVVGAVGLVPGGSRPLTVGHR